MSDLRYSTNMSQLFNVLITAVFILCLSASPYAMAQEENMFRATSTDPELMQALSEFERLCLPFILHEREVSYQKDLAHFRRFIKTFGFQERDLNETEKANQQMVNPAPRQIFTKDNPDSVLTLYWEFPGTRMRYEAPSQTPAQSCGISTKIGSHLDAKHIQTNVLDQDKDWEQLQGIWGWGLNELSRGQSWGQCTEFDGQDYYLNFSFSDVALLPGLPNMDLVKNAREEWVETDDPSLIGRLLVLSIRRDMQTCRI